jgi:hypothetical protein
VSNEEDECPCCGVERPCPLEEYAKICEFRPTADCVNALPENLRKYIHDLETRCDPAGDVAEIILTRDLMANVGVENVELQDEIRSLRESVNAKYWEGIRDENGVLRDKVKRLESRGIEDLHHDNAELKEARRVLNEQLDKLVGGLVIIERTAGQSVEQGDLGAVWVREAAKRLMRGEPVTVGPKRG